MVRSRGIAAVVIVAVAALALSGCVRFAKVNGKQVGAEKVEVTLVICQGDDACGDSSIPSGAYRALVGVRVPKGSDAPPRFGVQDEDEIKFRRSTSFTSEMNAKAPKGSGFKWVGYASNVQDVDKETPLKGKVQLRFSIPNSIGRSYKYRPTVGYVSDALYADDQMSCGEDLFANGQDNRCVDDPETKSELRKNLKIPLD